MNERFKSFVESLEPSFQRLMGMPPVGAQNIPKDAPASGVYLFFEQGTHLYAGRSRGLRKRIRQHYLQSSGHGQAPFAFRLAREATGHVEASYSKKDSRTALERDPQFSAAFKDAKDRIRAMEVRYVEEDDSLRQALLEMYVSVCLGTPYNDFATH